MKALPIRLRLTLWYLVIFTGAQFALGLTGWLLIRAGLDNATRHSLIDRLDNVRSFLEAQKPNATVAKLQEETGEEYLVEQDGRWMQIVDQDGNWIYRSPDMQAALPGTPRASHHHDRASTFYAGPYPIRSLTRRIVVRGRAYTVQVGADISSSIALLRFYSRTMLLLSPLALLIAGLGGYFLSRQAFQPIDKIITAARAISDRNLDWRLPALHTGDELQRLSETLNAMLVRIELAFRRTRELTADASHELRTPISLIRTEAEMALRRTRTESDYRDALSHIHGESERTTHLIESLLVLARADVGAETLHSEGVDLCSLAQELEQTWIEPMNVALLRFTVIAPQNSIHVLGDASSLRRLLIILLDNARKYTPAGGFVALRLHAQKDRAVIEVEDSGIGISPEHLPRIFDRFYRVDKARSRAVGGAGLGLALAHWIVQQHQGKIEVQSDPGKGTLFTVSIQRTHQILTPPTATQPRTNLNPVTRG